MKKLFLTLFILFSSFLSAEEMKKPPFKLAIGYGGLVKNNNRFDNQYSKADSNPFFIAIPFATINWGPLHVGGGGISLSFVGNKDANAFVNINRAGERYYGRNMDQRKDSVFAGIGGKYYDYSFLLSKDINGRSKGLKGLISYSKIKLFEDESMLRLALNLEFYNKNYANYYYGVKNNEVTSSRSFYEPNGYILPGFSAFYTRKIFEKTALTAIGTIKKYPSIIKDSPTTKGTDFELSGIFGLTWIFY